MVNDHILDLGGLLYYVSAAFIMLFLTVQTIEKREELRTRRDSILS